MRHYLALFRSCSFWHLLVQAFFTVAVTDAVLHGFY